SSTPSPSFASITPGTIESPVLPAVCEEAETPFLSSTCRKAALLLVTSFALGMLTGIRPASATGTLWCEAEDQVLAFQARSGLSRGINSSFLNFKADLQVGLAAFRLTSV